MPRGVPWWRAGRGHGLSGAAWSEPVNGVINSLWTTLVDKRSPSVQQVHADDRRLGLPASLPPVPPPSPPVVGLDSPFDSLSGGLHEPALAWTYRRRDGGRCPLPAHQSRRHARRAGTEMTFERAELGPGAASDDGEGRAGGGGCVRSVARHGSGHRGHRMRRGLNRFPHVRVKRNGERPDSRRCLAQGTRNRSVTLWSIARRRTYRSTSGGVG